MCPAQASRQPLAWYKTRVKSTTPLLAHRRASIALAAIGIFACGALSACGRSIGDDCQLNTDCSANGDRTCDLSQPGGYCTIEGCIEDSCPSEARCVRFFPSQFLQTRCDPACEISDPMSMPMMMCSAGGPSAPGACARGTIDDPYLPRCAADQVCIPVLDIPDPDPSNVPPLGGACAPRASERRLCVKTCGGNDDCRGGYTCRLGGTRGSLPLLTNSCGNISFCAPQGT
jgi:hypothetical protein